MNQNNSLQLEVLIDQACDRYESYFRKQAAYPDMDSFLDSTIADMGATMFDPKFRSKLATEIIRLRISLSQQAGLGVDFDRLHQEMPSYHREIEAAASSVGGEHKENPLDQDNTKGIVQPRMAEGGSGVAYFQRTLRESGETIFKVGDRLGTFELLEHLGRGGMGTVWRAKQSEPVKREVALKLMRTGRFDPQLLARFRAERQALATLEHPHIASIFDARLTDDGQPFLVMELVPGPPITEFADGNQLNLRQRIELFIPVCRAVQHAHQKGIIHRDLKPSNILVSGNTEASAAKVIDFGLAKATEAPLTDESLHTMRGQVLGTLDYMSPEQTRLGQTDVDTRSDIYSLGAVLYELLTGQKPFGDYRLGELAMERALKIVCEVDPFRPSQRVLKQPTASQRITSPRGLSDTDSVEVTSASDLSLDSDSAITRTSATTGNAENVIEKITGPDRSSWSKSLRGELDWIVSACLEKDPTRRYDSAAALAADLERHLAGEPVQIAPPSRTYQWKKLVAKNRGIVVAAASVVVALTAGLIATLAALDWAWAEQARATRAVQELNASRDEVQKRATELEKVASFQERQMEELSTTTAGPVLRMELLNQYRTVLENSKAGASTVGSQVDSFAKQIAELNFTDLAAVALRDCVFEPSLEAINREFSTEPLLRAKLLCSLSESLSHAGIYRLAATTQALAVDIFQKELGETSEEYIVESAKLGSLMLYDSSSHEAFSMLDKAKALAEEVFGSNEEPLLVVLHHYSYGLETRGMLAESEKLLRSLLQCSIGLRGGEHSETLAIKYSLSHVLYAQREYSEAEILFRQMVAVHRRNFDSRGLNMALIHLAQTLQAQDPGVRKKEVIDVLQEAYQLMLDEHGKKHPRTLRSLLYLAEAECFIGDAAKGDPILVDCLEQFRQFYGELDESTLSVENTLAGRIWSLGRYPESMELMTQLLTKFERAGLSESLTAIRCRHFAARCYRSLKQHEKAIEQLQIALGAKDSRYLFELREELFVNLRELGRIEEARVLAMDHIKSVRVRFADDTLARIKDLAIGVDWLIQINCHADAENVLQECWEVQEKMTNNEEIREWQERLLKLEQALAADDEPEQDVLPSTLDISGIDDSKP